MLFVSVWLNRLYYFFNLVTKPDMSHFFPQRTSVHFGFVTMLMQITVPWTDLLIIVCPNPDIVLLSKLIFMCENLQKLYVINFFVYFIPYPHQSFPLLPTNPNPSNRLYGGMNYRRLGGGVGVIKMTHCESHIW